MLLKFRRGNNNKSCKSNGRCPRKVKMGNGNGRDLRRAVLNFAGAHYRVRDNDL